MNTDALFKELEPPPGGEVLEGEHAAHGARPRPCPPGTRDPTGGARRAGSEPSAAGRRRTGVRAEELVGWLVAVGVDDATARSVRIGVETEGTWCLRAVPEGSAAATGEEGPDGDGDGDGEDGDGPAWEVFWSEQGGRWEWVRFTDEATACFALFGRLVWAQALRAS